MRRREFVTLLGGAAAWPSAARSQQSDRIRRIGMLSNMSSDDSQGREEAAAFAEALKTHGWIPGGNLQIDYRWGAAMASAIAPTRRSSLRKRPTCCWPSAAPQSAPCSV